MIAYFKNNNESFWAQLDPRSKILFTILLIFNVVILDLLNYLHLFFILLIIYLVILKSGYPVFFYGHKILKLYPMILLSTFLLPFSSFVNNDHILVSINQISIYESGLLRFVNFNIKAVLILSATMILTSTTNYRLLLKCFENMKMPYWLISILTILFRLIFLISAEMERMQLAYKSRFIKLSYFNKIKFYAQMIAVYCIRIIDRNDRTFQAMISRGFSGRIYIMSELTWNLKDSLVISAGFLFTLIIMLWK